MACAHVFTCGALKLVKRPKAKAREQMNRANAKINKTKAKMNRPKGKINRPGPT